MINRVTTQIKNLDSQAMRYIIAGLLTTFLNFFVFTVMTKLLKINVNISNVTAITLAIVFAYFANKLAVFKTHSTTLLSLGTEFSKFVGARLITMGIEVLGVLLLAEILQIDELISKAATQVLVVIGNFFISKLLVFRVTGNTSGGETRE